MKFMQLETLRSSKAKRIEYKLKIQSLTNPFTYVCLFFELEIKADYLKKK